MAGSTSSFLFGSAPVSGDVLVHNGTSWINQAKPVVISAAPYSNFPVTSGGSSTSRAVGSVYQNTTARTITIHVSISSNLDFHLQSYLSGTTFASIPVSNTSHGGTRVLHQWAPAGAAAAATLHVPSNNFYGFQITTGSSGIVSWAEIV